MSDEFEPAQSRTEAALQNLLGANNELEPPQSRVEAILQNMLGANNVLEPPQSREEALLQEIAENGIGGESYENIPLSENGFVRLAGTFSTTENSRRTDYIPLEGKTALRYSCRMTTDGYAVAFFDSSKAIISDISIGSANLNYLLGGEIDLTGAAYANAAYAIVGDYSTSKEHAGFVCMVFSQNGGGGEAVLINNKNISANGEYSASSDDADGYKKVTVDVPNTYAASDEGKVVSGGALVSQTAHAQVTVNGTIDTTTNNSVEVAVAASGMELTTVVDYTASAAVSEILIDSGLGNYDYYEISLFGNTSAAEWIYPKFDSGSTAKDMYINSYGGSSGTSVWDGTKMTVTKNISGTESLYTTALHKTQHAQAVGAGESFSYLRLLLYYGTSTFQSGYRVLIKGGNFS